MAESLTGGALGIEGFEHPHQLRWLEAGAVVVDFQHDLIAGAARLLMQVELDAGGLRALGGHVGKRIQCIAEGPLGHAVFDKESALPESAKPVPIEEYQHILISSMDLLHKKLKKY